MSKAGNKAAGKVNPNQDELDRIDEPEDDDTWHDTKGEAKDMKDKLKNKAQRNKPFDTEGLKQAGRDAQGSANQGGSLLDKASSAAKSGANNLKNQSKQNTPDDTQDEAAQRKENTKQRAREARDNTKDYLKEKVPKERREQTIYRLKKMIVEIQGHPDCECFWFHSPQWS